MNKNDKENELENNFDKYLNSIQLARYYRAKKQLEESDDLRVIFACENEIFTLKQIVRAKLGLDLTANDFS